MDYVIKSESKEATLELGRALGAVLEGGDVLCLSGDLGAGKTLLTQGIAASLGITSAVTSPTFTLIQEYSALGQGKPLRFIHMDLYRLEHSEEVEVIGVEDAFQDDAICIIEWPKIAHDVLPEDRLDIQIQGSGEEIRVITFIFKTGNWQERLQQVLAG
ncbi:tRNA (adenosine(37)-N6)-threonylcarbamoyltransferase complex ATPase subunit type 1 TsaE [Desulfitobacterium sp. Sab5]|uniref:tRNA (adenosine(37)-N6)-threonylcarbamoyltransferase complex ATPase subunit type 1 TsaE n=1 Tax=Desulfitobacterium TaxID=36853 RepID=UPI003CF5BF25